MNTIYLVDGKPHRICDCPKLEGKCPRGVERTLQTTQLSQCFVPAPDVLIAGSAVPEALENGDTKRLEWLFSVLNDTEIKRKVMAVSDVHAAGGMHGIRVQDWRHAVDVAMEQYIERGPDG